MNPMTVTEPLVIGKHVSRPEGSIKQTALRASIIVVSYNGKRYLEDCLGSLLAEGRSDYEIIVVDNASQDGSADYVEQAFPGVRLVRNTRNDGFGDANNSGAQVAQGEYLAFLNPDTVVEPGWLEALIAALEADPSAGLATSQILLLQDQERVNTCGNAVHLTGLTLCRGMGEHRQKHAEGREIGAVSGAAFVMRKSLFDRLGGFDGKFFLYMEDTDLSWRAALAGYKSVYVPTSIVYHDYRLRFGQHKTYYQERNRYLMLLKSLRWPTLLILSPALLLAEVVTWGFVLTREPARWVSKLRAYAWIAQHWAEIMRSRQEAQALRRVSDRWLLSRAQSQLAFEQTGTGLVSRIAHLVFDPLFLTLHRFASFAVRW